MSKKFFALLLCLSVCLVTAFAASAENRGWTILVYICGANLESDDGSATYNMNEMLNASASGDVRVIVETGGAKEWKNGTDANAIVRYVREEGQFRIAETLPLADMGDSATLQDFISWGAKNYPSEHMALVLWDHGSGSINGVCFDELYDDHSLTLADIAGVLENTKADLPDGFEFVGFDACMMATLENASMLAPYARYLYASEEVEPGRGWDYRSLLTWLAENPDADGRAAGEYQCESYYEFEKKSKAVTFSIVDLSKVAAFVTAFDKAAQELSGTDSLTGIVRAAVRADNFGGNNRSEGYTNMVDIASFLSLVEQYAPSAGDAVAALKDAVIFVKNGRQHQNACGLSMYYPLSVQGSREISIFKSICPSENYAALVSRIAESSGVSASAEAEAAPTPVPAGTGFFSSHTQKASFKVIEAYFDDDGIYTLRLDSTEKLAYATCAVFYVDPETDEALYLGEDDDVDIDDDQSLVSDNFDGTWMFMDGNLLPIELVTQNDSVSIYTCPIQLNGKKTNLRVAYNWDTEKYEIVGSYDDIDSENGIANRIKPLNDGDVFRIVYYHEDADGNEGERFSDDITFSQELEISMEDLPEGDYEYTILLYDLSGKCLETETVTFAVEADGELSYYDDSETEDSETDDSETETEETEDRAKPAA